MSARRRFVALGAILVLVAGWYAFRPERLFIDEVVNDAFPAADVAAAADMEAMPDVVLDESLDMDGGPRAVATGEFRSIAHETNGTATIYELEDGRRLLRLTGFATSNGPDVRIYLVAAGDAPDAATVRSAGFIDLGRMRGNVGDQNYEIPDGIDLSRYRAVTVWCRRFSVNFGTAPLNPVRG